jgi:hypothetical protein
MWENKKCLNQYQTENKIFVPGGSEKTRLGGGK